MDTVGSVPRDKKQSGAQTKVVRSTANRAHSAEQGVAKSSPRRGGTGGARTAMKAGSRTRKALSLALALSLVLTMFSWNAFASPEDESGTGSTGGAPPVQSSTVQIQFDLSNVTVEVDGQQLQSGTVAAARNVDYFFGVTPNSGYFISGLSAVNVATGATVPVYTQGSNYYLPAADVTDDLRLSIAATKDTSSASAPSFAPMGGPIMTLDLPPIDANWDYITSNDELGDPLPRTSPTAYARVYTAAGLDDVLTNYPGVTYVEFGNDLDFAGVAAGTAQVDINMNRASLVINARDFTYRAYSAITIAPTIRAGVASGSGTALQKITFRKWNIIDAPNNTFGVLCVGGTTLKEVEFDGLTTAGLGLLATAASATNGNTVNYVFNGATNPIDIGQSAPSANNAKELIYRAGNIYMVGDVLHERSSTGNATVMASFSVVGDIIVGAKPSAPGVTTNLIPVPDTNVAFEAYSPAAFVWMPKSLTIAEGASFSYQSYYAASFFSVGTSAAAGHLTSLTVGNNATFDVSTTGNVPYGFSVGVNGALSVGEGATFRVQANENTGTNVALSALGSVAFNNPAELLLYTSGTGNVAALGSGQNFKYSGEQLAYWNTRYTGSMPETLGCPTTNFFGSGPFAIELNTGTSTFTSVTGDVGVYSYTATSNTVTGPATLTRTNFSWTGVKLISNLPYRQVDYTIEYRDQSTGDLIDPSLFPTGMTNPITGRGWAGVNVAVTYPSLEGLVRAGGQPETIVLTPDPSQNIFVLSYAPVVLNPGEPGVSKEAVQTGDNEWTVTLTASGQNTTYDPMTHLDLMLVLDVSGSMNYASGVSGKNRLTVAREALHTLVNNLIADSPVSGDVRVGLAVYSSNNTTDSRTVLPLTLLGNGTAIRNALNSVTYGGYTYMYRGIDQGIIQLYSNAATYRPYTEKYMILMGDGAVSGGSGGLTNARNSANAFKSYGGKLITISMFESVAILSELQNRGFYQCNNPAAFTQAIDDIQQSLKASSLLTASVVDPMGQNFELVDAGTSGVTLAGDPNGGTVTRAGTNPQVLTWTLAPETSYATMTYKVRMKDTSQANTDYATNGATVLTYTNTAHPSATTIEFPVPSASYEKSILNVSYNGTLPSTPPSSSHHEALVFSNDRFEFAGPQDIYTYGLDYLTYNGERYETWAEFVAAAGVEPSATAGMFTIAADFAETRDLVYTYKRTTIPVNFKDLDVKVKDYTITFGDTLPAAYGFDNWPSDIPTEAFDVVYSRNTNNNNVGTYTGELRATVSVKSAYEGAYLVSEQPDSGTLTINAKPLEPGTANLAAEGASFVYNGNPRAVATATSTATGTISYTPGLDGATDPDTRQWTALSDYIVTNKGDYPVTFRIVGSGNYTGTIYATATGHITAASFPTEPIDVLVYSGKSVTYDGNEQEIASAKIRDDRDYTGNLYWTTEDPSVYASPTWNEGSSYKEINANTYRVWFRLMGTGNYAGAEIITPQITGIIVPAEYPGALVVQGGTTTYNSSSQRVARAWAASQNFTGDFSYSLDNGLTWSSETLVNPLDREFWAKDVGTYNVLFKLIGRGNYAGTYTAPVTATITPADLPQGALVAAGYDHTYTGTPKVVALGMTLTGSDYTGTIEYTLDTNPYNPNAVWVQNSNYFATDAGTYTVWFRLTGTGNYASTSIIYKQVTGTISKAELPSATAVISAQGFEKVYSESAQVVALAQVADPKYLGAFEYSLDNTEWFSGSSYSPTNVGDYPVYFRFTADPQSNYTGTVSLDQPVQGKITPLGLTTLNPSDVFEVTGYPRIYSGSEQVVVDARLKDNKYEGTFSYNAGSGWVANSSSYSATNVGSYPATFRFTGSGNYSGALELANTGSITAPTGTVISVAPSDKVYSGSAQSIAEASLIMTGWQGSVQYRINDGTSWSGWYDGYSATATNAGTYTIEYQATGTGNYDGVNETKQLSATISRKTLGSDSDPYFTATGYETHIYDGTSKLIAEASLATGVTGTFTYTVVGAAAGNLPGGNGGAVNATEADAYTIEFTLTGTGNYQGTLKKSVAGRIAPIAVEPGNFDVFASATGNTHTYDGTEKVVSNAQLGAGVTGKIEYFNTDTSQWTLASAIKKIEAGSYPVLWRFTGSGNYSGTAEKSVTGTISPASFPPGPGAALVATSYSPIYNGSAQQVASALRAEPAYTGDIFYTPGLDGATNSAAQWTQASSYSATAAASYPVTFKLVGTGNYAGAVAYATTTGTIQAYTPPAGTVLVVRGMTLEYTGEPLTIATAEIAQGVDFEGQIQYTLDGGTNWTDGSQYKQTRAGEYTASFRIVGTGSYSGTYTAEASCEITQKQIPADWTVVFGATPQTHTYDGSEKVVATAQIINSEYEGTFQHSFNGGTTWNAGASASATEAGSYPVLFRFTASGNYSGTITMTAPVTGTINAQNIPTDPNLVFNATGYTTPIYNEAAQKIADASTIAPFTGSFAYSLDGGVNQFTGSEATAIEAGPYTVTWYFKASGNYTGTATKTVTARVNPRSITELTPEAVFTLTSYSPTYKGTAQTVAFAEVTDAKYTGSFAYATDTPFYTDFSNAGDTYRETNVGDYPARFRFTGTGNYEGTLYQNVTGHIVTPTVGSVFTATFDDRTYTGQPQIIATAQVNDLAPSPAWTGTLSYTINGGAPVTISSDSATINELTATDAGTYAVVFTATGSANFTGQNQTSSQTVTISKQPVGPNPDLFFSAEGFTNLTYTGSAQTVAQATLVSGVEGTFTYTITSGGTPAPGNGSTVTAIEAATYTIVYTLTGTGNYTGTVSKTVSATIAAKPVVPGSFDVYATAAGYTHSYDGTEKLVSDASLNTGITGTVEYYDTANSQWVESGEVKKIAAATYPVNWRFSGSGNYTGSAEKSVTGTINAASFPPGVNVALVATPFSPTYTGSAQMVASAAPAQASYTGDIFYKAGLDGPTNDNGTGWTLASVYEGTVAGSYPVSFKLVGTGNYAGAVAYATTTGTIKAYTPPSSDTVLVATGTTKVYSGSSQVIATAKVASGVDFAGTIQYTLDGGTTWTNGSEYSQTDAGNYTASFRIVGTGNYEGTYYAQDECEITQKQIPSNWNTVFSADGYQRTYNGSSQMVASAWITNTGEYEGTFQYSLNGGDSWSAGASYSATAAGSYPVLFRLTASGNYTGTITMDTPVTGTINAQNIPTDPNLVFNAEGYTTPVYNEAAQKIADASPIAPFTGSFEYSLNGGVDWTAAPDGEATSTTANDYTVLWRFTASGNYLGTVSKAVTAKINARSISDLSPEAVFTLTAYSPTYTGGQLTVASAEVTDVKYTGAFAYATNGPLYNNFTNGDTYRQTNVDDYPVTFRFTGTGNYTGTLTQATIGHIVTPSVGTVFTTTFDNREYTGNPQQIASVKVNDLAPNPAWTGTLTYSINGGAPVTVSNSSSVLNEVNATDAGDYTVTFTATGSGNFTGQNQTASQTVTISKKDVGTDPDLFFSAVGNTNLTYTGLAQNVALATLEDGVEGTFTYTITGTEAGALPSGNGGAATATEADTYTITYTLTGTGNYTGTASKTVTGRIAPKTIIPGNPDAYISATGYTDLIYDEQEQVVAGAALVGDTTGSFTYTISGANAGNLPAGTGHEAGATEADTYTITFTLTGTGNYTGTVSKTVTGIINPKSIDPGNPSAYISASGYTKTYDATSQEVARVQTTDSKYTGAFSYSTVQNAQYLPEASAGWVSGSSYEEVDVGSYPVTFRFIANGDYSGTLYVTATGKIDAPTVGLVYTTTATDRIYNSAQQVIATVKVNDLSPDPAWTGTLTYRLNDGAPQTLLVDTTTNEITAKDAGTYTVEFIATGSGNFTGQDQTSSVTTTISPAPVDPTNPDAYFSATGYDALIYNSSAQVVADAALVGDTTGDFAYTISGTSAGTLPANTGGEATATDADTYTVTFTLTGTGNYTGTVSKTVEGIISPAPVDPTNPDAYFSATGYTNLTYNSSAQTVASAAPTGDTTGTFVYTIAGDTTGSLPDGATNAARAIAADTYTVTFTLTGTGNYKGTVSKTVTGRINTAELPPTGEDVLSVTGHTTTYNSSPQTVVSATVKQGTDYTGKIEYTTDTIIWLGTSWHEASEYLETDVGSYPATFRLTANGNYSGSVTASATGTITQKTLPADPSGVIVLEGYSREYNSALQTIVKASIAPDSDYEGSFSYSTDGGTSWIDSDEYQEKDVGSYEVIFRLEGTGNYTGSVVKDGSGSIYQKTLPTNPEGVLDAEGLSVTYTGSPQTVARASIANNTDFEGTISYSIDGTNWISANEYKATAAGSYPVIFRLSGTGNYTGTVERTVSGTITQATLPTDDPEAVLTTASFSQSYTGAPKLVARAAIADNTDFEGTISYTKDAFIWPWTQWTEASEYLETEVGTYPVTFRLTGTGNYTGTLDVRVEGGEIVPATSSGNLTAAAYTETYTGSEIVVVRAAIADAAPADFTGKIEYSTNGGVTWTEGSELKATNVGTYPVIFRLTATGSYSGTDTLELTGAVIAKTLDSTDPELYFSATGWSRAYTGEAQVVGSATPAQDSPVTGIIEYTTDGGTTWVFAREYTRVGVGTYPVTFRFSATGNYTGAVIQDVTGAITQTDIGTNPDAVLEAAGLSLTYTGSPQSVASVKVKDGLPFTGTFTHSLDGGATWLPGASYSATNVGVYPVIFKFVASGSYTGELTIAVTGQIVAAGLPSDLYAVLAARSHQNTYDGNLQLVVDAWVVDATRYQGTISYTTDNPLSPSATWYMADEYKEIAAGDYEVTFRFTATGNYTGTIYTTATGKLLAAQIPLDANQLMDVRGYLTTHTGADQVVASATRHNGSGIDGIIESSVDGVTWSSGVTHLANNIGNYPVTFRFTATGNYTGTVYLTAVGNIVAAPAIPTQPIIVNPPNVSVGGGTTIVQAPAQTEPASETTTTTTIEESPIPEAEPDTTDIGDNAVPLAGLNIPQTEAWSMVNMVIALATLVFAAAIALVALRRRSKNQKELAEFGSIANTHSTKTTKVLGTIAGITGLAPTLAFLLLDDFARMPMAGINTNTPIIAVLAVVFLMVFAAYFIVKDRVIRLDTLNSLSDLELDDASRSGVLV